MKEGTIILVKAGVNSNADKAFSALVNYITGSSYVHSAIYLGGKYWDFGIKLFNTKFTQGFYESQIYGDLYEPIEDLKQEQINIMINQMPKYARYNFIKLFTMWFVYPLRWFWKKINWVPFSKFYNGCICSEAIDSIYTAAGIDLIEGELPAYTSPGDLSKSKKLKKVENEKK